MLYITPEGHVDAERIKVKIFPFVERGPMKVVHGIVVHQTGGQLQNPHSIAIEIEELLARTF